MGKQSFSRTTIMSTIQPDPGIIPASDVPPAQLLSSFTPLINPIQQKRKVLGKSKPFKRSRPNPSGSRHGGAAHLKLQPTSTLVAHPIHNIFPVFAGLGGLERICELTYNVIQSKDSKLGLSLDTFKYVTTLCVYAKIAIGAENQGKAFPADLSALTRATKGVYLPDFVARYVESFGVVEVRSGLSVTPLFDEPSVMFSWPGNIDPKSFLVEGANVKTGWCINHDALLVYSDAVGRAQKSGLNFRKVDFNCAGSAELLVSYQDVSGEQDSLVTPYASEAFSVDIMHLGASFKYRERGVHWPGDFSYICMGCFTSTDVEVDFEIKTRVLDGFM